MFYSILVTGLLFFTQNNPIVERDLVGAWETSLPDGTKGLLIVTDDHFSLTYYKSEPTEFMLTAGGKWEINDENKVRVVWEFHTQNKGLVGKEENVPLNYREDELSFEEVSWKRIDDGKPGKLSGAWVITGRKNDGEMNTMTPGARKTMKILSGTKFQWIAYNSETGEFFGTGGGSYTTDDGKYIENIEFFSRDNTRVGASLEFDFKIEDGKWHHSGNSSKGDPIYEIWSTRQHVGI